MLEHASPLRLRSALGLALALTLGLAACMGEPARGDAPTLAEGGSGPAPELGRPPIPSEAECRECHPEAAASWAASRHHDAYTNADFQRAYAREPVPFCRDCHAPGLAARAGSAALAPESAREAEALGVGCHDCHVEDAGGALVVVSAPGRRPAAPHPLELRDDFATRSCARCHEFDFPSDSRRIGERMQLTMTEHRESAHAERSCGSCHLSGGDHSLASVRDPAALAAALEVSATREADALLLDLRPREVGHAFPTGDLYRRLELHAERRIDGELVADATRYLDREWVEFRLRDGRINPRFREPVVDDRLRAPTRFELALDGRSANGAESAPPAGGEVRWWIDYERVDARDDADPSASTLAGEVRLAEGRCTLAECERL